MNKEKKKQQLRKIYNPPFYRRLRFVEGIKAVIHKTSAKIAVVTYIIFVLSIMMLLQHYISLIAIQPLVRILHIVSIIITVALSLFGLISLITLIGTPKKCHKINEKLRKSGVVNGDKEPPLLIKQYPNIFDDTVFFEFYMNCVDIEIFKNKQSAIQSVLKRDILPPPEQVRNNEYIRLVTAPTNQIPKKICWRPEFLDNTDGEFNIILGKGKQGLVSENLDIVPHWIIGSASGGGKSVLLKNILRQCILKGAEVHIIDLKGGIDFENEWHRTCDIIIEENRLIDKLDEMNKEMERRIRLFKQLEVNSISRYNNMADEPIKRIILAFDEVADILSKTGVTRERKELLEKIEGFLEALSRKSRAVGINLIFSSQRLDSKILSGQIRSNFSYRICGRADENLKEVILGTKTPINDIIIPPYEQGLFVDNNGAVFRGFMPFETEGE